mgnify:CR=1 FL=1
MIDAKKAKHLLAEHEDYFRSKHWFAETYVKTDGFHFNIRNQLNGCSIVDSYQALHSFMRHFEKKMKNQILLKNLFQMKNSFCNMVMSCFVKAQWK